MVPVAQPSQSYPSTHSSTMAGMQGTRCKGPGRQLWTPPSKVSDSVPDKGVHTCAYPRQGHLLRPSSAPRKQSNSKVWNGVGVGGSCWSQSLTSSKFLYWAESFAQGTGFLWVGGRIQTHISPHSKLCTRHTASTHLPMASGTQTCKRTQLWSACKDSRGSPEANGSHGGPGIRKKPGRRGPGPHTVEDTFPFQAPLDKPLLLTSHAPGPKERALGPQM